MSEHERLDGMLTRLKLTAVRERLDTLRDEAARAQMTQREALAHLCQADRSVGEWGEVFDPGSSLEECLVADLVQVVVTAAPEQVAEAGLMGGVAVVERIHQRSRNA